MMVKIFLLFVVTLIASSHGASFELDSKWDSRVVGGSNAGKNDAEYQVSLRTEENNHFCGGSIIGTRTILTTAKCVNVFFGIIVYTNTTTLNSGGTRYTVRVIKSHPGYDGLHSENDLGLVITYQDIVLGNGVKQIKMGTSYTEGGATATFTGWGETIVAGPISNDLQIIKLKTISYEDCQVAPNAVYKTQICTFTKKGEGACYGDRGGPLVVDGELVGMLSWITPCAEGLPDVYTRVSSFVSWINEHSE